MEGVTPFRLNFCCAQAEKWECLPVRVRHIKDPIFLSTFPEEKQTDVYRKNSHAET